MSTQDQSDRAAAKDPGAGASTAATEEVTAAEVTPSAASKGTTKDSENGDKAPPPDGVAADTLDEFRADLKKRQSALTTAITKEKAQLSAQESQQQKVKKQLTELDRAAGDLARSRTDSDAVVDDADQALADAAPLIGQLQDDVEKKLRDAVDAIDKVIHDKQAEVGRGQDDVRKRQAERDEAHRTWARLLTAFDEASAQLTGLPAAIKQLSGRLKALRSDLVAAIAAGHAVKACVLAVDVQKVRDELERRRGDECEAELIKAVTAAEKELADAGTKLATADTALSDGQTAVQQRSAELAAVQQSRPAQIRQLFEAPPDAAPVVPAA